MGWIEDNFRSRRGLLREIKGHAKLRIGISNHPAVNVSDVQRLIFVCKGNICRSALAEAVAVSHRFPSRSFGLKTTPGKGPDPRMLAAASEIGIDFTDHRTERFSSYVPDRNDLVLCFEEKQLISITDELENEARVTLLGNWISPRRLDILDPYGGSPAFYLKTARLIQQCVTNLLEDMGIDHGC